MKAYLRLLKYLRPYWKRVVVAVVCMFVFASTSGALAFLVGPAIKVLFQTDSTESLQILPFDLFTVQPERLNIVIPFAIILIAIVKGLSSYGNIYHMGYVGLRVISDLRRELFKHLLRLPVNYFVSNQTGDIISKVTMDVNTLLKAAASTLTNALKQVLTLLVLVAVVISLDWKLSIAALLTFPLAVYPAMRFGRLIKKAAKKGQITMGTMNSSLFESVSGIRIVKAFGMEGYELKKFNNENERFAKYRIKTVKVRGISTPLMETIGAVGFAATIWYASYRISEGTLKPEEFMSFFAALIMIYQPIKALNGVHLAIQQGLASVGRIFEVMDTRTEPFEATGTRELGVFNDSVEFKGVDFSYGEKQILNDIDLTVKKGERIAIVGSSGAGKSTFVNLIPRFYDVTKGSITVDGTDVRELTLASLRSNIAIVSQEVILFNDTIRNNIAYGELNRSVGEIEEAAKAANVHDFVMRMSEGYDTVVGQSGLKLSGGERQRLSIARAMLKNAPILVMDEATSSLDTESELAVQQGLDRLLDGRTAFVIAHRLSTVKNSDRIIVLSGGSIVESGTHNELLAAGGEYSRLYNLQFKGLVEDIA